MGTFKEPTVEQVRRLETAPYLSLVAYFHPRPSNVGDLIASLVKLSRECFGDLRISGKAARRRRIEDSTKLRGLRAAEVDRICNVKLPNTLRRLESDDVIRGLNSRKLYAIWAHQMRRHRETGLNELVWYLTYHEHLSQYSTVMDPYIHLFLTLDRFQWQCISLQQFIVRFFELGAETGRCYGGLADPGRWRDLMGYCYHDFCAGSVAHERQLNDCAWIRSGNERRKLVRGVYWGTMLPAHCVKKLGGFNVLSSNWLANCVPTARVHPHCMRLPRGGAWLTLTNEPGDVRTGSTPSELYSAAWLHNALRKAGLLL